MGTSLLPFHTVTSSCNNSILFTMVVKRAPFWELGDLNFSHCSMLMSLVTWGSLTHYGTELCSQCISLSPEERRQERRGEEREGQ